jgi:putative transposase
MAFEHGQEAVAVRRISGLDHEVEDQAASARRQVEFATVLNITGALDDDVGVRLEQADDLLGLRQVVRKWKMPPREWAEARTQFAIMFGERFVRALLPTVGDSAAFQPPFAALTWR